MTPDGRGDGSHGSEPERSGSPGLQSSASGDTDVPAISRGYVAGSGLVTNGKVRLWTAAVRTLGTVRLGVALIFLLATGLGSCICLVSH
jgi:hypothetical protein